MEDSPLLPFIRPMLSQPIRLHCCCSQQKSWEKGHSPDCHGCFWLLGGSPIGLTIGLHTETLQTANDMETVASSADLETQALRNGYSPGVQIMQSLGYHAASIKHLSLLKPF